MNSKNEGVLNKWFQNKEVYVWLLKISGKIVVICSKLIVE